MIYLHGYDHCYDMFGPITIIIDMRTSIAALAVLVYISSGSSLKLPTVV